MPNSLSRRLTIPARVESATLAKFFKPGDATVVLKLLGVGNTAPFYLTDKVSRTFVLKWDSRAGGHIIRIPHSLWQADEARMAHDLMEQRRLVNAMIITFELPEKKEAAVVVAGAAPADGGGDADEGSKADDTFSETRNFSNQTGATEPGDKACIVVGPGRDRRPVAPTLGRKRVRGQGGAEQARGRAGSTETE